MKKGDKIVTSSGIIGVLHTIDEDSVLVEVGSKCENTFSQIRHQRCESE